MRRHKKRSFGHNTSNAALRGAIKPKAGSRGQKT